VSVWSGHYPGYTTSSPYHRCECAVQRNNTAVTIQTFESHLNCSSNGRNVLHSAQTLTLDSNNRTLYTWPCNEFVFNEIHNDTGDDNLMLVWNGQTGGTSGKFWIEFQGRCFLLSCNSIVDLILLNAASNHIDRVSIYNDTFCFKQ